MEVNYKTLTSEELEEKIEFVDWSLVPIGIINEDIKSKFKNHKTLNTRLWFERLLSRMVIKEDKKRLKNKVFFFLDGEWCMDLDVKTGYLSCSYYKIWRAFEKNSRFNYPETQGFIKNVFKSYIHHIDIEPLHIDRTNFSIDEMISSDVELLEEEKYWSMIHKDILKNTEPNIDFWKNKPNCEKVNVHGKV